MDGIIRHSFNINYIYTSEKGPMVGQVECDKGFRSFTIKKKAQIITRVMKLLPPEMPTTLTNVLPNR